MLGVLREPKRKEKEEKEKARHTHTHTLPLLVPYLIHNHTLLILPLRSVLSLSSPFPKAALSLRTHLSPVLQELVIYLSALKPSFGSQTNVL